VYSPKSICLLKLSPKTSTFPHSYPQFPTSLTKNTTLYFDVKKEKAVCGRFSIRKKLFIYAEILIIKGKLYAPYQQDIHFFILCEFVKNSTLYKNRVELLRAMLGNHHFAKKSF